MDDRDDRLIVEVQRHKCLYDISRSDYKDQDKKANAWRSVAAAVECEGRSIDIYF